MSVCIICHTNHRDCQDHPYTTANPHAKALGKLGGKVKSEKKAESSRKNGKLGGRPKKRPA